ncbi:hypothetical protein ABIF64_007988 [Bradyrhizobium japonicum]
MVTKSLLPMVRSVGSSALVGALPWRAGKVRETCSIFSVVMRASTETARR